MYRILFIICKSNNVVATQILLKKLEGNNTSLERSHKFFETKEEPIVLLKRRKRVLIYSV